MTERYPSIHGVGVSPLDIWLPESQLDPEINKNYNNHHTAFYARMYGGFLLSRVFHDLASNQTYMLRDVHAWLHEYYGPPEKPTPLEMVDAIEEAWETSQVLQIRQSGGYFQRPLDTSIRNLCVDDYNKNRGMM